MRAHEMLRYAYHHGVKTLFLKNPKVLGKLRRLHRNYNWRVTTFRNSIVEMIVMRTPLYSIKASYVDPRETTYSKEHDEIMRRYRLD